MSYPKTLDEYSTRALETEYGRRVECAQKGLCDYCGQKIGSVPMCRWPARHNAGLDAEQADAEFFLAGNGLTVDPVAHIPPLNSIKVLDASNDAFEEVEKQDVLARQGKFGGTHIMPGGTDDERLRVLVEEVGEVAIELNEASIAGVSRTENLRKELVQTAAVAIAWVAAIDEGRPADGLPSPVDLSQTPEFATEAARRTK